MYDPCVDGVIIHPPAESNICLGVIYLAARNCILWSIILSGSYSAITRELGFSRV